MGKRSFMVLLILAIAVVPLMTVAQQLFRLPDKSMLKHLTTKQVARPPDVQGKQITLDYYSAPNGDVISMYSIHGKHFAFSTHSNTDPQHTYRLYMDMNGNGAFQQINPSTNWQVPPWTKGY